MFPDDAPDELLQLRAELAIVREQADQARDKALVAEAEVAKVWAINADLLARNAHLELMNEQMRGDKYGARSERSRRLLDQLELTFEELEANASEAELLGQIAAAKTTTVQAFTRKRSTRRDFPADLPREQVVIPAPDLCPCCGSDDLIPTSHDADSREGFPKRRNSDSMAAGWRAWPWVQRLDCGMTLTRRV